MFELDLGHIELSVEASLFVFKIHLAAYLLLEQLDNARFLWKRLPTEPRDADPELCALWAVGKAMWVKDHAGMQSAITAFSWSPPLLEMMMQRLQREHLSRCFAQAVCAYSLVSAESLSQTIGAQRAPLDGLPSPSPTTLLLSCAAPHSTSNCAFRRRRSD